MTTHMTIRIQFKDGTFKDLELQGYVALQTSQPSLSINSAKNGKFYLCVSESMIPDFSKVDRLDIIRP